MEQNELISYAMEFASFLIKNLNDIEKIILYGSVARGDFDSDSDIDLFIDADEKKNKKIQELEERFYKTEFAKKWKLKGIENEFSILVGKLDGKEWENLRRAMINTGILLYGKYKSNTEKVYSYSLFVFENIKPDKKRVAVFRKLFGFKISRKSYSGLLEQLQGIKLGKSSVIVPLEHAKKIKDYFHKKKVSFRIYDLWADIKITG